MSNYTRPTICWGNSFKITVSLEKYENADYTDFDLNTVKSLEVYMVCSTHQQNIPLEYEIDPDSDNTLICMVDYRLTHPNTSYGICVEGIDEDDKHFRWYMQPREGILVVNNTSGQNIPQEVETVDLFGRVGFGGPKGETGPKGDTGATGPAGETGPKGDTGPQGETGPKGDTGPAGTNGVESINGVTGAVTLKTINNEELIGTGNITIENGVTSFNGQTGAVTYEAPVLSVNGMTGAVIIETGGVTSFNGETGAVTYEAPVLSVNGMTGTVNIDIPVTSVGGVTGDVTLKTINNQELVGTGNITITDPNVDILAESVIRDNQDIRQNIESTNSRIDTLNEKVNQTNEQLNNTNNGIDNISRVSAEALNDLNDRVYTLENNPSSGGVTSFNGATGAIVYTAPVLSVNGMTGNVTVDIPEQLPYEEQYLTIVSLADNNTISWKASSSSIAKNISISLDDGATWTSVTSTTSGVTLATLSTNQKMLIKGSNTVYGNSYSYNKFISTKNFNVEGNIMSLIYGDDFIGQTTLDSAGYNFYLLFVSCTYLIDASNLILPATTLVSGCYNSMFQGCTSLTKAPELPTTTLADSCYSGMFRSCTSLTKAPELPATTLVQSCYSGMFQGCTSLTKAPELPSTALAYSCYYWMFNGCTKLNYIKCLATNISASNCLSGWTSNVSSTGTFITNDNPPAWSTGTSGIPTGWNVYTESEYEFARQYQVNAKQDTLVSGVNIKTINNESLLGTGNISISGGSSEDLDVLAQSVIRDNQDIRQNIESTNSHIDTLNEKVNQTNEQLNNTNNGIDDITRVSAESLNDLNDRVNACVTSSQTGLKIEIVASIPTSPDSNTIYIVQ